MNQDRRDTVCHVVRRHVLSELKRVDTCVASIRVLSEVLLKAYGVSIAPHVVNVRIYPEHVLNLLDDNKLTQEDKVERLKGFSREEGIVGFDGNDFHVVGESNSGGEKVLWDPSIDQINEKSSKCHLEPLSVPYDRIELLHDGSRLWFWYDSNGCRVMYSLQAAMNEAVFNSPAWVENYSVCVNNVMKELAKLGIDQNAS